MVPISNSTDLCVVLKAGISSLSHPDMFAKVNGSCPDPKLIMFLIFANPDMIIPLRQAHPPAPPLQIPTSLLHPALAASNFSSSVQPNVFVRLIYWIRLSVCGSWREPRLWGSRPGSWLSSTFPWPRLTLTWCSTAERWSTTNRSWPYDRAAPVRYGCPAPRLALTRWWCRRGWRGGSVAPGVHHLAERGGGPGGERLSSRGCRRQLRWSHQLRPGVWTGQVAGAGQRDTRVLDGAPKVWSNGSLLQKRALRLRLAFQRRHGVSLASEDTEAELLKLGWNPDGSDGEDDDEEMDNSEPLEDSDVVLSDSGKWGRGSCHHSATLTSSLKHSFGFPQCFPRWWFGGLWQDGLRT